jgi:hypothetical protein
MNYVISSIILLAIILIIIYILSIDNNTEKLRNKFKEIFSVVKSNKVNYLSDKDNINLLNYLRSYFRDYQNVIIPHRIYYNIIDKKYKLNTFEAICYKYNNNILNDTTFTVNMTFIPTNKDNYIGSNMLFNMVGNYELNVEGMENEIKEPYTEKVDDDVLNVDTDIMDMIPDIIHLSEDSPVDTTDTATLISHNLK